MERYDKVDLDLECEYGGTVAHKASLFGGMFKKPSKAAEPSAKAQDSLSVNGELSTSSDSLAEINSSSSSKDKGGMFKGMFKKTTKSTKDDEPQEASISSQHPELSVSSDSLTDNKSSKDKSGMFGGILKRSPRLGHTRRPSQDLLDFTADENLSESTNTKEASISSQHPELSVSSDSLADNKSSKDKSGMFGGILKRSPRLGHTRRPSQDLLDFTADENLSESTNTKESAGKMKKSPKANGTRAASKEDLTAQSELSKSNDSLSKTKESGGFSAIFKNPFGARAPSQEDVCAAAELPGSSENLSENNTKEKGFFSGMFKKKGARSQSQDDLSVDEELSASNDNLTEKSSKGGVAAKVLKNASSPQEKEKTENCGDQNELSSAAPKPKTKKGGFSAMMKSTFYSDKQEKNSEPDDEESSEGEGDGQPNHKQSKLAGAMTKLNPFKAAQKHEKPPGSDDEDQTVSSEKPSTHKQSAMVEAMSKLNPFRSAAKKDTEDTETPEENRKQSEKKPDLVKRNLIQPERKEKGETPPILRRPRAEEMKATSMHEKERQRRPEEKEKLPVEKKGKRSETPIVPPRPSEEEMNRTVRKKDNQQRSQSGDEGNKNESNVTDDDEKHNSQNKPVKVKKHKHQLYMPQVGFKAASDDEGLKDDESLPKEEKKEEDKDQPEKPKVKKPKQRNPFMPRNRATSDDEGLKDEEDSSSKEEIKEDEEKEIIEKPKVKKPKKHNPFMPRVKPKVIQRSKDGAAGENEEPQRSLFDQLEDFRIEPSRPEDSQEVEDLMDWWNTVESWEDTPQDDDMTEKEEAKAFAVTAEKVQKGIRVFNKLFSERAESLWQHVIDLNAIADGLDKFTKKTKIAQITGGSTSAIGGVATITGLALAPVTMGTSLIVTAVGLGVATAGGLTSAGAGISNQVNNSMDRKKVEKIVEDYQDKIADLNKCLKFIKQGIENLRRFDLLKMKKSAYNQDFPALTSQFYEDGAMAGKAILINANEIMRVVQIANVAGSTAARAVQIASMATGVLTGLFVAMDIYFVAKDSKELKKGAKSDFAAKIREVATQLHDGLVELNTIREELQSTAPDDNREGDVKETEREKNEKYDESSEDEIDRIKKALKKDLENKEYV
ncbi:glutamic acid-rich protein isoform X13 [Fundulus heteroclitus]|uniref:glutamic acid-rich protein isoform X13 n=1 Tax=Fundulus heteroclitus TaxID=8078 RepID=UPI00165B1FA2|nr:glutamic acid-rich protein isoform X13 [Fundulus heteroclitus]